MCWPLLVGGFLFGLVDGVDVHVSSAEVAELFQLEKTLLRRVAGRDGQHILDEVRADLADLATVEASKIVGKLKYQNLVSRLPEAAQLKGNKKQSFW